MLRRGRRRRREAGGEAAAVDAAGDSGADSGEERRGEPVQTGSGERFGVRIERTEMGAGVGVLQKARREPGAGAVPEAVEQPRRRLQEDQGVGVAGQRRNGLVLAHEERFEEGEEIARLF